MNTVKRSWAIKALLALNHPLAHSGGHFNRKAGKFHRRQAN